MLQHITRAHDAFVDPRMPQWVLNALYRKYSLRQSRISVHLDEPIFVSITFDVETPFGSSSNNIIAPSNNSINFFLLNLDIFLSNRNIQSTLFIQGNLVRDHAEILREFLSKGHSLGLHGYNHELWGKAKWFLSDKSISVEKKDYLLKLAIKTFLDNGLGQPNLFRAPNMVIDQKTLDILSNHGFEIDSSIQSFMGALPLPTINNSSIIRIPVSANPIPQFRTRYGIPHSYYQLLDVNTILNIKEATLKSLIPKIISK